jgi:hypothetical protein
MNERDLRLYQQMNTQLGMPPRPGLVLLDVRTTQFVPVELVLLKVLLDTGRPGLFISVDRPHQYMVHLLHMHRIDHRLLTFLDAVARFSADRKLVMANVGFLQGPRNIDTLPAMLRQLSTQGNEHGFDIGQCAFAMIDNLSTLLNFNNEQVVRSFLQEFLTSLGKEVSVPLLVDRDRHPRLFQTLMELGGVELQLWGPGTVDDLGGRHLKITDNDNGRIW